MSYHLTKLLFQVLKAYGVSITRHTIEQTVLIHSEFPSIQSVSDTLDSWMVKHEVSLEKVRSFASS